MPRLLEAGPHVRDRSPRLLRAKRGERSFRKSRKTNNGCFTGRVFAERTLHEGIRKEMVGILTLVVVLFTDVERYDRFSRQLDAGKRYRLYRRPSFT